MILVNLDLEHIDDIKHDFEQALTIDIRSPVQLRSGANFRDRWRIGLRQPMGAAAPATLGIR